MKRMTEEQRVAKRLTQIISDVTLDIEQLASVIAQAYPNVIINRILLMADILKQEKDEKWTHENLT